MSVSNTHIQVTWAAYYAYDAYIWGFIYNLQKIRDLVGTFQLKLYWYHCSLEDESNVSEEEKVQQKHKQKQLEKPLASALKSKSACSNCCSWFPSCQWRWCCSFNGCKGKCCC